MGWDPTCTKMSPLPVQALSIPMATAPSTKIFQGRPGAAESTPPKDFNLNPTQVHSLWIPSLESNLGPVPCIIPKTALRSQPPTPSQETPGKTSPPESYNRAFFMLLLQVLTPWNRVGGGAGEEESFRNKLQEAQRRRLKNGVKDNQETTSPPQPSLREPWRLRQRGGRCGGSQRQRPGGSAGQRLHNIYRKIRHPQASSPTSSHPEQFWADRGSGGGREACLGPPWRRGGRAVC